MDGNLTDKAQKIVEAFTMLHAIRAKHSNAWSQEEEDHLSEMDALFDAMGVSDFESLAPALDAVDSAFQN